MKYIIKSGNGKPALSNNSDNIYLGKCPHCGCEFIFDNEQIDYDVREREAFIRCPHCGQIFTENYKRLNDAVWIDKIKFHLNCLEKISNDWSNPLMNDAGGSSDCQILHDLIVNEIEYFNQVYNNK